MKKAYTLIFDGYADWELAFALTGLRRYGNIEVVTVGFSDGVVTSMGGLRVVPDTTIAQLKMDDLLIFIVPGGEMWEGAYPVAEIEPLLHQLSLARIPVAAICAATTVLARAGTLKGLRHTSNALTYLSKMVPGYAEHEHYVDALAASDGQIITASGLGSVDFAMQIFTLLDIATPEMRALWYDAFKHGRYPETIDENS